MTDMLLEWLSNEVRLSKQVTSIEEDFSSGYLIGEILHKYKQISNFHEYKNKNDSDSKFHNFKLVEKALRDIEIKVDSKRMKEISEKRKGVAAKFLFSIKMTLAKKQINFEGLLLKKSNQLQKVYSSIKYPNQNEKYLINVINKKSSPGYEQMRAEAMSPANLAGLNKNKIPDPSKNKYENRHLMNDIQIFDEIREEDQDFKIEHDLNAKSIMEKEKYFHQGNLEKDKRGLTSWTNNIANMKDWEKKQKEKEMKEAEFFKAVILDSFKKSAQENEIQIEAFDKNLSRLGLDVAMIDPKLKRQSNSHMSAEIVMQKIKEKLDKQVEGKKEKERRNRLINLEQAKAKQELENKKKEESLKSDNLLGSITSDDFSSAHKKRLEYENMRIIHERNENNKSKQFQNLKLISDLNKNSGSGENFYPEKQFNREDFLQSLRKENSKFKMCELNKFKVKRERDFALCTNVFNLILDITEEAYNYQNNNNVELVEVKDWRNWMQKFISNEAVNKEGDYFDNGNMLFEEKGSPKDKEAFSGQSLSNRIPSHSRLHSDLEISLVAQTDKTEYDENEFLDYTNFKGQWNSSTIPHSILGMILKMSDVLGNDFFLPVQGTKSKNAGGYAYREKSIEYEPRDEDIDNLTIPSSNSKNFLFGEIIDLIVDIKFLEETVIDGNNNNNLKSVYSHIPIKISLIGHSFAGKKTQAKLFSDQNSNIKAYAMDELVKRTLETLEKIETPIEANPKFKTLKKNQIDQLQLEKAQEEEKFLNFKKIILPIRESMKNCEPISDELIVDLLFEYIKQDFPEKDPNTVIEDILKKHKKIKEIAEELQKIKEEQAKKPKAKVKEEQQLLADLSKINSDANKGFIIVDFPQNLEQAKILEHRLTGYVQDIEKPKSPTQVVKDNFALILDKPVKPPVTPQLKQGGLDLLIHVDVPTKESIRRAAGRRLDPNTGVIYHIEDNPPNSSDHKLLDRLVPIDDPNASDIKLNSSHFEFDMMLPNLIDFYDPFGFHKLNWKFFNAVNGFKPKDQLSSELTEYVLKLQKINEDREQEIISASGSSSSRDRQSFNENLNNVNASNVNSHPEDKPLSSRDANEKNQDALSQVQNIDEEDFIKYSKKLEETKKKLNHNTIENIYHIWSKLFDNYENECRLLFRFVKKQSEVVCNNFNRLQVKFIEFLKRPSRKSEEVMKYHIKFSKFVEEYPDLRDDLQVKEEFHQDVMDLSDRIWEIIDMRKNEAIEERKKIMSSGWIENEMEKFYTHLEKLFLAEVEKFLVTLNIVREYYNAMDNKNVFAQEMSNLIKPNEVLADISSVLLEDSGNFPKINKLYKNCVKLIFKYEEKVKSIDKMLKLNVSQSSFESPVNKKLSKVATSMVIRKPNDTILFSEDRRDIFIYEEELKSAIKLEKNKFKYRVSLLKHWGVNNLTNMRKIATAIYESLDDWIISTIKAENEAMNNLIYNLKMHIERQVKNVPEFELDGFDIYQIEEIQMGFDNNSTTPEPLKNIVDIAKFNLTKYKQIVDELKTYQVQKNFIRISSFVEIYFKKHLIDSKNTGIPQTIRNLSFHNFSKLTKFFELNSASFFKKEINIQSNNNGHSKSSESDFLNVKNISTILALIHCRILDDLTENNILTSASEFFINNAFITKENFLQIEFWFESDISTSLKMEDEPYQSDQERALVLKETIFEIYKEDNNTLMLPNLLNLLSLRVDSYISGESIMEAKKQNKTYYDILLF